MIKVLVDADACPQVIRTILLRAVKRLQIPLIFVANQAFHYPKASNIKFVVVEKGFDVADNYIVKNISPNDLVITADIPLAGLVVDQGGYALSPRGEFFTSENVKQKLAVRNLMADLRGIGAVSGGPASPGLREQQAFANALDRFLTAHRK